jgi:stage II sporulation protein D
VHRPPKFRPQIPARVVLLAAILLTIFVVSSGSELPIRAHVTPAGSSGSDVRVGVLGLFHTKEFRVSATDGQALVVREGEHSIILEKSSGSASATIQLSDTGVLVAAEQVTLHGSSISVTGRQNQPVDFILEVPHKITRRYHGTLHIASSSGSLLTVLTLDLETAVASVVAAESAHDTPMEALKAQAVASRSYFVAGRGRHQDFDFCDTTHCQFLKNPPASGSSVALAVETTRGLVLEYNTQPFPAMYTPSCSGKTRTPAELGLPSGPYPYYSAECEHCRTHPVRWTSRIAARDAATLRSSDESSRLEAVRRLGWNSVPSNNFSEKKDGDHILLTGIGHGHGIGLCQSGAKAMAEQGSNFREILALYYPNTSLVSWQP